MSHQWAAERSMDCSARRRARPTRECLQEISAGTFLWVLLQEASMRNRIVRALARLRGLLEGGRRWALVLTLVAGVLAFGRVNRFSVAPVELRSEPPRAGAQPAQDERFDPRSAAYGLVAGQAAQ